MLRSEKRKQYDRKYRERNKEKARKYREENKEKIKEKLKIWRSQNQEKIKLYRVKNKERNKIKVKEYQKKNPHILEKSRKKWAKNNKEFLKEWQKNYIKKLKEEGRYNYNYNYNYKYNQKYIYKKKLWRKKNRDKQKEYNLKYSKTDKGIHTHLWDKLRMRIKTYTFSKIQTSRKDMNNLIGCSKIFLKVFIENQFYDYPGKNIKMSWDNRDEWHIDHITPLALLNPENEEHFQIANHFSNLKPMWAYENLKKSSKIIPGYGISFLKRKYKKIQYLGDLTEVSNEEEAKKLVKEALKLINKYGN
tara:strand:+ start:854 stop:1765 length:912 start_codon:yes stop_codon:yes gene_type:complete